MAVHKHEARVVESEPNSGGAFVRRHSFYTCLRLDYFDVAVRALLERVLAGKEHCEAAEEDLLSNALVALILLLCTRVEPIADQGLPLSHSLDIFGAHDGAHHF